MLEALAARLDGQLHWDDLNRMIYATDASVYRRMPLAVAYPKTVKDLQTLVSFASDQGVGLIPRSAGTSLAGQCVGEGIIVDTSRYFTEILEVNVEQRIVRVQPGVIRDELNAFLRPYGLFFGPNTSTSNRCMIGGMVGNNSSGTTSIRYGVTRDKVVAMKTVLADGREAEFKALNAGELQGKCSGATIESKVYSEIHNLLKDREIQNRIITEFPKPEIHRRNTGYAVDALLNYEEFGGSDDTLNLCDLLCGSEGTLGLTTEITLSLDPLPPSESAMVVTHYKSLEECLADVAPLMQCELYLCEMMDRVILDCTKNNRAQLANRFFVAGDPAALLMLEVRADTPEALDTQLNRLMSEVEASGLSYAHPVLRGADIAKAIELRKAGLGLLGNMVGDRKAVACIEDTAVALDDLKDFIGEFTAIMDRYGQNAVYYAHAGAGELHLRPILNLKEQEDVGLFREITTEVARLTKKYRGSFSGEHGDGIVRAEFIPLMIGEENYQLLRHIKAVFDPDNLFNPGKIVDAYPMDEKLRYMPGRKEPEIETFFDFSDTQGILRAAEQCNGSGDCRKTARSGGAMCPSYHATLQEKDTTRARANALREVLTEGVVGKKFTDPALKEVLDLCLSCKACASECPSNVDMATLKAEVMYQRQEKEGYSLRNRLFAYNTSFNRLGSKFPALFNGIYRSFAGSWIKKFSGVSGDRSLPEVSSANFDKALEAFRNKLVNKETKIVLYIDEFTRYLDTRLGIDAIKVFRELGYQVSLFYGESGRTFISKGFLKQASRLARKNLDRLNHYLEGDAVLVGLEPSALLSFRDEYLRMKDCRDGAIQIQEKILLFEEFLAMQARLGVISSADFHSKPAKLKAHVHCHQKALSDQKVTFDVLNLPENYEVTLINSGCCGMAGSFGYEKEHYDISMRIGETRLFPAVRKTGPDTIVVANGTSCRHQIKDGTGRQALHPVSVLAQALDA